MLRRTDIGGGVVPRQASLCSALEGQDRGGQPGGGDEREQCGCRSDRRGEAQRGLRQKSTAGHGPRPRAYGKRGRGGREDECLGGDLRVGDELAPERVRRPRSGGSSPRARDRAAASSRRTAAARAGSRRRPPRAGRRRPPAARAARARVRPARRSAAAASAASGEASGPAASSSPVRASRQFSAAQSDGEHRIDDREPDRDVREREERRQRARTAVPRAARRSRARLRPRRARAASRRGRTAAPRRPSPEATPASAPGSNAVAWRPRRATSAVRPAGAAAVLRRRRGQVAQLGRRGAPPSAGAAGSRRGRRSTVSRMCARQVRAQRLERRRAVLDAPRRLDEVAAPERMLAGECFPEDDAEPPHVGGRCRGKSLQPLGRDVRERARDVAERGQRVELGHLREPEVEEPHVDARRLGEQHVRRLDVAVDDPAAVRVRERVGDLAADLERCAVVELAGAQRLAHRASRHVLVGDVDVGRVAREREDALAARVAERGGGAGLALGPVAALALAGDDLQGDVEAALLVAGEPDMAHSARAEGADRPVPAQEELVRKGRLGHAAFLRCRRCISSPAGKDGLIRRWTRATTNSSSISSTSRRRESRKRRRRGRACRGAVAAAPGCAGRPARRAA